MSATKSQCGAAAGTYYDPKLTRPYSSGAVNWSEYS